MSLTPQLKAAEQDSVVTTASPPAPEANASANLSGYEITSWTGMWSDDHLDTRGPDQHAFAPKVCTAFDLFAPNEGKTPPAELIEDINQYLGCFVAPILKDGKNHCFHCGLSYNGGALDNLFGEGGFEWGLAHGDGRCRACKWPARLYHFIKDRHGEDLMTFRHLVLAYLPEDASPHPGEPLGDSPGLPETLQKDAVR